MYNNTMLDTYNQNTQNSLVVQQNLPEDIIIGYIPIENQAYYEDPYCYYQNSGNCYEDEYIYYPDEYIVTELTNSLWAFYDYNDYDIGEFATAYTHKTWGLNIDISEISISASAPYIGIPIYAGLFYAAELDVSVTLYV